MKRNLKKAASLLAVLFLVAAIPTNLFALEYDGEAPAGDEAQYEAYEPVPGDDGQQASTSDEGAAEDEPATETDVDESGEEADASTGLEDSGEAADQDAGAGEPGEENDGDELEAVETEEPETDRIEEAEAREAEEPEAGQTDGSLLDEEEILAGQQPPKADEAPALQTADDEADAGKDDEDEQEDEELAALPEDVLPKDAERASGRMGIASFSDEEENDGIIDTTEKLQQAIHDALAEGGRQVIEITSEDGSFALDAALAIAPTGGELVFRRAEGGELTLVSAAGARHFSINGGSADWTLAFEGVTLDGGNSLGGIFYGHDGTGNFTVDGAHIINCTDSALYISAKLGDVTLKNSKIEYNTAAQGAGVRSSSNTITLTVRDSSISHNTATGSGGGISGSRTVLESGAEICFNKASSGGGVQGVNNNQWYNSVTMYEGALVHGNEATYDGYYPSVGGGGIKAEYVSIYGGTITNNRSGCAGGGVASGYDFGTAQLIIENATITGNSATLGGGVYSKGNVTITGTRFEDNTASHEGGGMYIFPHNNTEHDPIVRSSTFVNNRSASYGGAISVANKGVMVYGGEFRQNHTDGHGGAISASSYYTHVDGAAFIGNTADGGALYTDLANPITTAQKATADRHTAQITNIVSYSASPDHLPAFSNLYNNYDFAFQYYQPCVAFMGNGGLWADESEYQLVYAAVNSLVEPDGLPEKHGYVLDGWFFERVDGTKVDFVPGVDITTAANFYIYARWAPEKYALTYDLGTGATASNPAFYTIEDETFSLNAPTRSGYTFLGWTGDGFGDVTTEVSIAQGSTGARHFTAHWEEDEVTTTSPDTSKPDTSRPDTSKPDTSKPDTSKPETSRPETSRPETSKPETSRPETSRPDTSRPDTSRPETSRPETSGTGSAGGSSSTSVPSAGGSSSGGTSTGGSSAGGSSTGTGSSSGAGVGSGNNAGNGASSGTGGTGGGWDFATSGSSSSAQGGNGTDGGNGGGTVPAASSGAGSAAPVASGMPVTPIVAQEPVEAAPDEEPQDEAEEPEQDGEEVVEIPADGVDLAEEDTPLAGHEAEGRWALLNLLLVFASLAVTVLAIVRRQTKRQLWQALGTLGAVLLFFFTQDLTSPMAFVDWFTIPMLLIVAAQGVWALLANKQREAKQAGAQ